MTRNHLVWPWWGFCVTHPWKQQREKRKTQRVTFGKNASSPKNYSRRISQQCKNFFSWLIPHIWLYFRFLPNSNSKWFIKPLKVVVKVTEMSSIVAINYLTLNHPTPQFILKNCFFFFSLPQQQHFNISQTNGDWVWLTTLSREASHPWPASLLEVIQNTDGHLVFFFVFVFVNVLWLVQLI